MSFFQKAAATTGKIALNVATVAAGVVVGSVIISKVINKTS